jgi:hypothetical protein
MEWRPEMEMDFEKRRKEIIHQLEDIRSQLMNSLEVLEKFKKQKIREAKARAEVLDQLAESRQESVKTYKISNISLN